MCIRDRSKEEDKELDSEVVRTYQNKILRMITALLLAYEQAFRNSFNYNKLAPDQMTRKAKDSGCAAFTMLVGREIIRLGLQPSNCLEIVITTLQILLLLCEQKEIIDRSDLIPLFTNVTECLTGTIPIDEKLVKTYEVLSLCAIIKLLDNLPFTKGKDPFLEIVIGNKSFLSKICLMRKFKEYLRLYVDMLISKIGQYPFYSKPLINEVRDKLTNDVKVEKIIKAKYEPLDKMWRKTPTELKDCKMYKSTEMMEEWNVEQVNKGQLPCVTRRVFEEGDFKEAESIVKTNSRDKLKS
eukprot:TRINITY_DN10423_c0_g1_i2.p1 TRINITY_DN10423_c0_g1~~TRINITY_DN10423_c0_g1_i2.p1  ORF type:complete len:297 (-),score=81.03 TRINITY_DN10423_c0_g1_i2:51-941(-)